MPWATVHKALNSGPVLQHVHHFSTRRSYQHHLQDGTLDHHSIYSLPTRLLCWSGPLPIQYGQSHFQVASTSTTTYIGPRIALEVVVVALLVVVYIPCFVVRLSDLGYLTVAGTLPARPLTRESFGLNDMRPQQFRPPRYLYGRIPKVRLSSFFSSSSAGKEQLSGFLKLHVILPRHIHSLEATLNSLVPVYHEPLPQQRCSRQRATTVQHQGRLPTHRIRPCCLAVFSGSLHHHDPEWLPSITDASSRPACCIQASESALRGDAHRQGRWPARLARYL